MFLLPCIWLAVNKYVLMPLFGAVGFEAMKQLRCSAGVARGGPNTTGLRAIVVALGGVGTTSVHLALEAMGLRTYGSEEAFLYLHELAGRPGVAAAEFVPRLRACGVDALVTDDWVLKMGMGVLPFSPGVKVVIMQRDWPGYVRWRRGQEKDHGHRELHIRSGALLCHWLPWGLFWPFAHGGSSFFSGDDGLTTELFYHAGVQANFMRCAFPFLMHGKFLDIANPDMERSEANYTRLWGGIREHVLEHVPPGDVLEFDIKRDGVGDLAAFLGHAGGVRMPQAKVRNTGKNVVRMKLFPAQHVAFFALMLASITVNWAVFKAVACSCSLACRRCKLALVKRKPQ